jgi:hypothetical protein
MTDDELDDDDADLDIDDREVACVLAQCGAVEPMVSFLCVSRSRY